VVALHVVATVLVYNEADIVGQVLDNLREHGISFVVLDGGSQDGSIEIAQGFKGRGLLEHKVVRRSVWKYREDLDCLIRMAAKHSPDWIVYNDADEFLEPREPGQTLYEAIAREDQLGFNVIQFDNFDFCLTERDYESREPDIRKRLRFYTWCDDYRYKAWKYCRGATLRDGGGHYPVFPGGVKARVSPRKLVMRHYRFRSLEQAFRKVFAERLPRYAPEELAIRWHVGYYRLERDARFFVHDSRLLSEYSETGGWDVTRRLDYPGWRNFPSQEYLFGRWSGLRNWARRRLFAFLILVAKLKALYDKGATVST
jgi:glycosyltransferase involved in cell wall biosynthesis